MQNLRNPPQTAAARAAVRRASRWRNGGFPEPLPGEPVRLVRALHPECGAETRVRLPATVGEEIVRRVVCGGCGKRYRREPPMVVMAAPAATPAAEPAPAEALEPVEPEAATEPRPAPRLALPALPRPSLTALRGRLADLKPRLAVPGGSLSLPRLPSLPRLRLPGPLRLPGALPPRAARLTGGALVGLCVLAGLIALQGGSDRTAGRKAAPAPAIPAGQAARFLKRPTFSLALPKGWRTARAEGGAALRIVAPDGSADATLWIQRDPSLSFKSFEARSLRHLKTLADDARVYQRLTAPTAAGTIVQLRADLPAAGGTSPYLVTLRAAGPYRYYLATSVEPDAPRAARRAAALVHGTFLPRGDRRGRRRR